MDGRSFVYCCDISADIVKLSQLLDVEAVPAEASSTPMWVARVTIAFHFAATMAASLSLCV